jgi:hypothetical protein
MASGDRTARAEDLERILQLIGLERFNQLVRSVPATREKGRLRYWQEQLFARVAAEGRVRVASVEEYLRLFSDASELPVPQPKVDRDSFLRQITDRPFQFPLALAEIPSEWMAAAWAVDGVLEAHADEMARTVSKVGAWVYEGDYVRLLARSLTASQLVDLFVHIRDRSPHREAEFRPGFERSFPAVVPALPAPRTREQLTELAGDDLSTPPAFDPDVDEDIPE